MLEQPAFGHRLRELRKARGMSQAALAGGALSTGYISRLESGTRQPTRHVVEQLAKGLGVPLTTFETRAASPLATVLALVVSSPADDGQSEALMEALPAGRAADPALRWQALWLAARLRGQQNELDEQLALLTEMAGLADELTSAELRSRTRAQLSRCARNLGDYSAACRYAEDALDAALDATDADRADALLALVSAGADAGRLAEAAEHADELCALAERSSALGSGMAAQALWANATVHTRQGDYAQARKLLERALDLLDSRTDLRLWLRLRLAASSLYLQISPPVLDEARRRLDELMTALELVGSDVHRHELLALRAQLAFQEGRIDDARSLSEMLSEKPLLLSFRDRMRFQALQGQLLVLDGRVEEGTGMLEHLAREAEAAHGVELAAEIWRDLAQALAGVYHPAAASTS